MAHSLTKDHGSPPASGIPPPPDQHELTILMFWFFGVMAFILSTCCYFEMKDTSGSRYRIPLKTGFGFLLGDIFLCLYLTFLMWFVEVIDPNWHNEEQRARLVKVCFAIFTGTASGWYLHVCLVAIHSILESGGPPTVVDVEDTWPLIKEVDLDYASTTINCKICQDKHHEAREREETKERRRRFHFFYRMKELFSDNHYQNINR